MEGRVSSEAQRSFPSDRLRGMRFRPEHELRQAVGQAFERHRALIAAALPNAEIEHIGATAVVGAWTKGDLDLLVRVSAADFAVATERLRSLYEVNQPENWSAAFASFRDVAEEKVPVGVQLVVAKSADDGLLVSWRDRLASDRELLERYNAFKQGQAEASPSAYSAAKAKFIEGELGRGMGGADELG